MEYFAGILTVMRCEVHVEKRLLLLHVAGQGSEHSEASALRSTLILHPVPLHSAAHEGCAPCQKCFALLHPRLNSSSIWQTPHLHQAFPS